MRGRKEADTHLIEQTPQNSSALSLTAPPEKGCSVIAPAAGEISLLSLQLLVNAPILAGARSIPLFSDWPSEPLRAGRGKH